MGILAALRERHAFRAEGTPSPGDDFWYGPVGRKFAGQSVTADAAMRVAAVYACDRVIKESVASLPIILYHRLPRGKERAVRHPLYRTLHVQPNPWQTIFQWLELGQGLLDLRGNFYAEILPGPLGDLLALRLMPIHPDRVTPERLESGSVRFKITDPKGRPERFLAWEEMFHVPGPGWDGLKGMNPIECMRSAIGLSLAAQEYGGQFFENDATPGGVITHPGHLTDEAYKRLKESWQETMAKKSRHSTAILEEGVKFERTGVTNRDAQFIEARKFQISEIARMFRVPPHLIGDLDRATNNNIEHQSLEFVIHTLRPWLVRWEQAINTQLIDLASEGGPGEYFCEFLVDALLRGDTVSRHTAYGRGILDGWLTRNEAREKENLNPLDGLDEPLQPLNMIPAGARQEEPPAPPRPGRAAPPEEEEEDEARAVAPRRPSQTASGLGDQIRAAGFSRAISAWIDDAAGRIVRAEVREIEKALACGNGHFAEWLPAFYGRHRDFCEKALEAPLRLLREVFPGQPSASEVAAAYSAEGAETLRAASLPSGFRDARLIRLKALALGGLAEEISHA